MKHIAYSLKTRSPIFFVLILLLAISSGQSAVPAFAGEAWLEGASGYASGVEQAKVSGKPMIVMFYTDWCGYCRKLQKNVLDKPEVQSVLSNFVKIRVNPDKGGRESQLAEEYGIQGYPTVFLEKSKSQNPPMELGGATRNSSAFIAAINEFLKS